MPTIELDAVSPRASESCQSTAQQIATGKKLGRPPKPRDDDDRAWRGVAPPASFDLASLPDSSWLLKHEVAQVLRRAPGTLEAWRRDKEHPLKWEKIDGRWVCSVGAVRAYIAQAKDK